ncbi:toxin CcdB [Sphingobium sp. B7D2B]|uniref:CcdB family protein n=1 Tax=unclassified Sphingobium TaxID=2611147 RepID=UPI00222435C2|nr:MULTISPECIES: CcdB family protein [unclassified Sphingobium]MCW2364696.1 toxin CcdB [Sphingobium sp. B7D2B]
MAQYDVVRLRSGQYVVDCQAEVLSGINTRFVVPLAYPNDAPPPRPGLNPRFRMQGEDWVLVTQFAGAVSVSEIQEITGSLAQEEYRIKNALDMLLTGV